MNIGIRTKSKPYVFRSNKSELFTNSWKGTLYGRYNVPQSEYASIRLNYDI